MNTLPDFEELTLKYTGLNTAEHTFAQSLTESERGISAYWLNSALSAVESYFLTEVACR